jgi:hypothetical protein
MISRNGRKILLITLVSAVALMLAPRASRAQAPDCGRYCQDCGFLGSEGYSYSATGAHSMTCYNFLSWCKICGDSRTNDGASAEDVLARLKSGTDAVASQAASVYRGQLLVSATRNLVAIRGTKCDPNALVALVFVSPERARLIKQLGAIDLASGLRQAPQQVALRH